jgi:hypothetical protein
MVEYYLGKRGRFAYGKESTYGGSVSSSEWGFIPINNITPTSKSTMEQINTLDETPSRDVSDYFESLRTYGATVEGLIQHFAFCMLAWGDDNYSSPNHVITGTHDIPSFAMNFGYDKSSGNNHIIEQTGCKVNKLDISCEKGEFLKFNAEVIAQKGTTPTSFRSWYNGASKRHYSITEMEPYHYSGSTITINDDVYCATDSIKLSINNNLLSEPTLCAPNGKRIGEPVPQIREHDASVTVRMKEPDLYDLWEIDDYVSGTTSFRFVSGSSTLTFTLNDMRFESAISPVNLSDGIVLVELPMKCTSISVNENNSIGVEY